MVVVALLFQTTHLRTQAEYFILGFDPLVKAMCANTEPSADFNHGIKLLDYLPDCLFLEFR
jgi:hypothetical protein